MMIDPRVIASALLIVAAFPPWNFDFLIWVALVPWFWALDRDPKPGKSVFKGVFLGALVSLGGFYWVAHSLRQYGELSWPWSIAGLILFCFINQPQFYVFAFVYQWLNIHSPVPAHSGWRGLKRVVFLSFIYTGVDWILPKLFVDTMGHALYAAPRIRQLADIGGPMLLTFMILNSNLAIYNLFKKSVMTKGLGLPLRLALPEAAFLSLMFLSTGIYGSFRLAEIREAWGNAPTRVQLAAIQANIGDFDKIAGERGISGASEKIIATYLGLSEKALKLSPKPHALIWPETAYPSTFRSARNPSEERRERRIVDFVREQRIPLLFGGYDHRDSLDFNSLFALNPWAKPDLNALGREMQTYHKNILLWFGEYIPGSEWVKGLRDAFPQVANFGRGPGPQVLDIQVDHPDHPLFKVGPIICYEALFPNYVIQAAKKGSELILNITNDSWFGPDGEPELHLALTTFRSIETRLPQLRATNTGISALITPDGEITHSTAIGNVEILSAAVPVIDPIPTVMKALGDWFGPFSLWLSFLGMVFFYYKNRRTIGV